MPVDPPISGDGSSFDASSPLDNSISTTGSTSYAAGLSRSVRIAKVDGIINLNVLGERLVLDITGLDEVTVQAECISGAFPASCVLTQKVSNDGYRYDAISGAATITSDGMTVAVNVTGNAFYAVEVTDTNTGRAFVSIVAKATS